jgi:uncharacterized membrane protein YgcG
MSGHSPGVWATVVVAAARRWASATRRPLLLPLVVAGLLAGCETPPYYDGGLTEPTDLPPYSGAYGEGGSGYDDGYYPSRTAELCRIESARVRVDRDTTCDCDSRICYRDGAIDKSDTRDAFGDRAAGRADDLRDRFGTGRVFVPGDGVACVFTTQTCYKDGRPDPDGTRDFFGEEGGRRYPEERRALIRQLDRLRDMDERPQRADDDRRDRERRPGGDAPAEHRRNGQERQADHPRDGEPPRRELVHEREGRQERGEAREVTPRQEDRRQERGESRGDDSSGRSSRSERRESNSGGGGSSSCSGGKSRC